MKAYPTLLGVDTGGTFTDFFALSNNKLQTHKVPSTPTAPEQAILKGIKEMGISLKDCFIVHGSTVATNAVLEGKMTKVAYITNQGFEDVLTIGRQARKELYNLTPQPSPAPVNADLCFGLSCRIDKNGNAVEELNNDEVEELIAKLQNSKVTSLAINFLFSWKNPSHEQHLKKMLHHFDYVCCSSEVLSEIKEYERGIATWINAGVGPLMRCYLENLDKSVRPAKLEIMQSMGGTIPACEAGEQAVRLLLSGPAGGLNGAKYLANLSGIKKLLTFDMGGTSTDVAVIQGDIRLSSNSMMAGYPVSIPMVDMHTIGAGGGSIAYKDEGGLLQVGPESAGALPGPAAYGNGGLLPTVTDANVLLGRIPSLSHLGGSMKLDMTLAEQALSLLAESLSLSVNDLAKGIIRLANEHMAAALRLISIEKGIDLKGFTLTSFGGAGGLHVCALAELMGLESAFVPVCGGVLSAVGMLAAPKSRECTQTINCLLSSVSHGELRDWVQKLTLKISQNATDDNFSNKKVLLCLRYQGQSSSIEIEHHPSKKDYADLFSQEHVEKFGYDMEIPIELVTIKLVMSGESPSLPFPIIGSATEPVDPVAFVPVVDQGQTTKQVPCYQRDTLACSHEIEGPAVIIEKVSTTWIAPTWSAKVDKFGNLILTKDNK